MIGAIGRFDGLPNPSPQIIAAITVLDRQGEID
jgi:hypothetical protein